MYLVMSEISLETLLSSEFSLTVDEILDEGSLTYKMNKLLQELFPGVRPIKLTGSP